MMLVLRVLRCKSGPPAHAMRHVFDERGGTVGRDEGNDFVLQDPDSLVSRVHARIEYRGGSFYIVDVSTNGVFVNGAKEPLGHGDAHRLDHGDHLRLGDYLVLVELEGVPRNVEAPATAVVKGGGFAPPPAAPAAGTPVVERSATRPRLKVDYDVEQPDLDSSTLNLDISLDEVAAGRREHPTTIRLAMATVERLSRDPAARRGEALKALSETQGDLSRLRASLGDDRLDHVLAAVVDDYHTPRAVPIEVSDQVHFSVSGPSSMRPGNWYTVDVWVHTAAQRNQVLERANESQNFEGLRIKSKGPVRLARDTVLNVDLKMPDLHVSDPEDTVLWSGEVGNTSFAVLVPPETPAGSYPGTVAFYVDQFRVAKVHFTLVVDQDKPQPTELDCRESRYGSAFASYASEDRDEVLGRVQGMQKVMPQLDVFLDVVSLRSGERWRDRLTEEIRRRDVFYLFWSRAASKSVWVDREWRTAWRYRGVDAIDPVPLVKPEEVPPPKELADHLHFNDWVLAYRRGRSEASST